MINFGCIIATCLIFGLTFCYQVPDPCQSVPGGVCSRGQYVVITDDNGHKCLDCPEDTYQDFDSHNCDSCKIHTQPRSDEIITKLGSSTEDNVVACKEGYFRAPSQTPDVRGSCRRCTQCEGNTWPAGSCTQDQDTFCCINGLQAVQQEGGVLTCDLSNSRQPRELNQLRKERSSANKDQNATTENEDSDSNPDHRYSRADYETEYQHNKIEFPVWARILCAGVAIGVFLFYLGVGIPCNACGSRDKLRVLRKWMFRRHEEAPTQDETKEKPTEKRKPSVEQV